jgi:hypothetical protein
MLQGRPAALQLTFAALAVLFFMHFSCLCVFASSLKEDERIIFFPTSASLNAGGASWSVPIHGWVFEPEEDSVWRSVLVDEFVRWLEIDPGSVQKEVFQRRARMFLVDNERGKQFTIRAGGSFFQTETSAPNGHFYGGTSLDSNLVAEMAPRGRLSFHVDPGQTPGQDAIGHVQVVPPSGISVISDLDDTIKISNVLDRKELLQNTFLREFVPVPGMPELYCRWKSSGAIFHYVSGSPWQLYPELKKFMDSRGFPKGSFALKDFRVKDRTFFNLFSSPEKGKKPAIESIITRFPDRQFILVGDSGERDPEIYGDAARRFPRQVVRIFIRNVPDSDVSADRFDHAFKGLEKSRWFVFDDPAELPGLSEIAF